MFAASIGLNGCSILFWTHEGLLGAHQNSLGSCYYELLKASQGLLWRGTPRSSGDLRSLGTLFEFLGCLRTWKHLEAWVLFTTSFETWDYKNWKEWWPYLNIPIVILIELKEPNSFFSSNWFLQIVLASVASSFKSWITIASSVSLVVPVKHFSYSWISHAINVNMALLAPFPRVGRTHHKRAKRQLSAAPLQCVYRDPE